MKHLFLIAALSAALPAMAQNVATVNGKAITQAELDNTINSLRIENASPEQRQAILEEIINRDVLAQEAIKLGLDKKEDIKLNIEAARKEILIANLLLDWNEKNKPSSEEIKKAYDDFAKAETAKTEYHVRHILVKDEEKANQLYKDITNKKRSFEEVAKAESIDPGSGSNGGDLGWAIPEMYVQEFAQGVLNAKKGELTKPVRSEYGYHLIELVDQRSKTPPSFEQAQADITRALTQQKMFEFIESLRKKAKVEVLAK